MKTRFLLLLLLLTSFFTSSAQSWEWVQQFGAADNESADELQVAQSGTIYLAGTYQEGFSLGTSLPWGGETDAYLSSLDADGNVRWTRAASGNQPDRSGGLALAPDESQLYWAGSYWEEVRFGDDTLRSSSGGKAIFLACYETDGELRWLQGLNGSGLRSVGDLVTAPDGSLYLTGYFGGTLLLGDTTLTASGEADAFLARFDADGQLRWAANFGSSGFVEGTILEVLDDNSVYFCGHFRGRIGVGSDTIRTNTSDNDLFIARIAADGEPLWLRKAGGVHQDISRGSTIDDQGRLYLSGYYYGILKLSDGITLQATGFNDNFYILQYDREGEARWAQSYGGEGLAHSMDIEWKAGELVLGGYFRQRLTMGNTTYDAQNNLSSFIAGFDLDGNLKWSQQMASTEISLLDELALLADGQYLCAGSFRSSISFGTQELTTAGNYDIYLAQGNDGTTAVTSLIDGPFAVRLYPNPVQEQLFLQNLPAGTEWRIIDVTGRRLRRGVGDTRIDVSTLQPGQYFLQLFSSDQEAHHSFIKL
ncbi:MAG: T9SS type A sorting domain-containing protein [Bacteroidota bacterium]